MVIQQRYEWKIFYIHMRDYFISNSLYDIIGYNNFWHSQTQQKPIDVI